MHNKTKHQGRNTCAALFIFEFTNEAVWYLPLLPQVYYKENLFKVLSVSASPLKVKEECVNNL